MTTEFKPNHNPTAEAILGFARSKDGPDFLLGFNGDGNTYIQVDYYDPGAREDELGSETWGFDSHEAALAVFLDLRSRMVDETRKRTLLHHLEELQVSGRLQFRTYGPPRAVHLFLDGGDRKPSKAIMILPVDLGRTMKDQRSLVRLVDEFEHFIKTEGL